MTKFTDRLENDLGQIADQATPSPTAWQAIQQRMAEPEPNQETEIIMLTAEPEIDQEIAERKRNWLAVAAAVAVAVIAAGVFAVSRGGDDELIVTDDPPVTDQDSSDEESAPSTTEAPTTTEAPPSPVVEARPIVPGLPLKAGLVRSDLLGEELTLELPEDMVVAYARPGEIQLNGTTEVPKFLTMARVGSWYSGTEAIDSTYRGEGSIAPWPMQEWIDDNGLIGERRPGFLSVSGRIATIYDVSVDPAFEGSLSDDCLQCRLVYSVSSEFFDPEVAPSEAMTIRAGLTMRIYFFEGDEGADPFVFFAAGLGDDTSFIDEFEETIFPTIGFEQNE